MSLAALPDLPWRWIGIAVAVLLVGIAGLRWRARRERRRRGYSRRPDPYADVSPAPNPDPYASQAVTALRGTLDRQAREIGELRASVAQRFDAVNGKLADLAKKQARQHRDATPTGRGGDGPSGYGAGGYGAAVDSGSWDGPSALPLDGGTWGADAARPLSEPAWSPGPGDQPVEVRDGVLVVSRSLPPAGYVAATGGGQARVYLNADVPVSEFALPKWAVFFDLEGARPYAMYRTRRPAEVRWDAGQGRGELISKGLAEAI